MSRKKQNPKPESPETEPQQSPYLGDLTPEYILWHQRNKSEKEHIERYFDRIPHEYSKLYGIERV